MNFTKLFHKSNSSIYQLQGNVLDCTIEQIRGNKVIIDTGASMRFVCFRDELCEPSAVRLIGGYRPGTETCPVARSSLLRRPSLRPSKPVECLRPMVGAKRSSDTRRLSAHSLRTACFIGIEEKGPYPPLYRQAPTGGGGSSPFSYGGVNAGSTPGGGGRGGGASEPSAFSGELTCNAPSSLEKLSKRKLVWTELTKLWRTQGRVKGFILNSVNGGYAVALAGYIAFLPKSLCLNKKVFIGQWRQFAIISMNPKIANIVVKEIKTSFTAPQSCDRARSANRFVARLA